MKAKIFTLTSILLLFGTVAFVSCKKSDAPEGNQQEEFKSDDAAFIMSQFAEWDDEGNLLFRTKGFTLNEADDTEVSLCVETWEEALSMFKEWMPEGADFSENSLPTSPLSGPSASFPRTNGPPMVALLFSSIKSAPTSCLSHISLATPSLSKNLRTMVPANLW